MSSVPSLRRRLAPILLPMVGALVLSACATREMPSDGSTTSAKTAGADAFPVQLTVPGGKPMTITQQPARIVSLSPAATETLYAIGAGKQVAAVDDQSTFPQETPRTQLSGFKPNVEAIAKENPDLVIVSNDLNNVVGGLTQLKVPVLLLPAAKDLDEAYGQWTLLGRATGHNDQADQIVRKVRAEIKTTVDATPKPAQPLKYYHELGPDLFTATSATFIGKVYAQFGLVNVADPADSPSAGGYPQLGQQALFQANPDLIFLADSKCCGQNAQTVGARPQWQTLAAVKNGRVFPLDDDIASRWTPRIVELVSVVSKAVADTQKAAG